MPETSSSGLLLPFEKFYGVLRENGFPVTPLQVVHANKIIVQYAAWVKNELELCGYLTPVFSGNEDEQELFKKLFARHFAPSPAITHPQQNAAKPGLEQKIRRHWKNFVFVYAALAFIAVVFIFRSVSLHKPEYDPGELDVFITDKSNSTIVSKWTAFRVVSNGQLNVGIIIKKSDLLLPLQTEAIYDWGDGSEKTSLPQHIYINPGEYKLKAWVHVIGNGDTVKRVYMSRKVFVCPGYANLDIALSKKSSAIYPGENITCKAVFNNSKAKPLALRWMADSVYLGNGDSIQVRFTSKGSHTISCMVTSEKQFDYCDAQKDISVYVTDKPANIKYDSTLVVDMGKAAEAPPSTTDIPFLAFLYKILMAVFAALALLFAGLWIKELKIAGSVKTAAMNQYKSINDALANAVKDEWIPFRNKNYLPATEPDTVEIAKQLRRRVKDHFSYLHIPKTIYRSIAQGGFFTPVNEERTRPSEYLLVIEETGNNSMQVKLFEYLAFLLKKHGLLVDVYYYRSITERYYNFYENNGTTLEKLYNKHPGHIILFLGSGRQLADNNAAHIKEEAAVVLKKWQYKAVVTAAAYPDWQETERSVLLPGIPVVPADMHGLILLAGILTEKENSINIKARLNLVKGVFYSSRETALQNVNQLLLYCRKIPGAVIETENGERVIFFEWVASLAVYPSLRWEIILALGKAIFEQYGKEKLLNYSALLRLVRIRWIQEGKIPGPLRLELLKTISKETEILARETILQLLKEVPGSEIPPGSTAYAEREIQQVINQFSLYATDPVYYSSYHQSKHVFKKLWENKQLNDETLEAYLQNPFHQRQDILNKPGNYKNRNYKVTTEVFLRSGEREETLLGKVYLAMAIISAVVAVSSLFALRVLFVWGNYL